MDKLVFDKGLVLPDKLICLSKTCVSNARGSAWGMLMPIPRGRDKIANAPPPGLTTWVNAPRLPGGDGHRLNWLMHNRLNKKLVEFQKCSSYMFLLYRGQMHAAKFKSLTSSTWGYISSKPNKTKGTSVPTNESQINAPVNWNPHPLGPG